VTPIWLTTSRYAHHCVHSYVGSDSHLVTFPELRPQKQISWIDAFSNPLSCDGPPPPRPSHTLLFTTSRFATLFTGELAVTFTWWPSHRQALWAGFIKDVGNRTKIKEKLGLQVSSFLLSIELIFVSTLQIMFPSQLDMSGHHSFHCFLQTQFTDNAVTITKFLTVFWTWS
jgi:hypothetical protein